MSQTKKITQEEKIWSALSYVWVLSLVALAARKNNEYIRFHANQGFMLFILSLFIWFPVLGWLLGIIVMVLSIIGILKALKGEEWPLPVLSSSAIKSGEWLIKIIKL